MSGPLDGITIVEIGAWVAGPAAGGILADWGAEVIKIEHPAHGDPMRGMLRTMGYDDTFNVYAEQLNHAKRSVGIDLSNPEGRSVLMEMLGSADVFLTSYRESARQRWGIAYEDVSKVNPTIVYGRSSGQGHRGPDADERGYDMVAFWARSSMGHMARGTNPNYTTFPSAGIGDLTSGIALAGGIAAALVRRGLHGEGALVDVSLLGTAIYTMYEALAMTSAVDIDRDPEYLPGTNTRNPLTLVYTTRDARGIALCMIASDRFWPGFCQALDRQDLLADERLSTFAGRSEHRDELREEIAKAIASFDLDTLMSRFRAHDCIAAPFQTPREVLSDPQALANGYFVTYTAGNVVAASPVQFDDRLPDIEDGAPEVGQHTEEVLLELGFDWDRLTELKGSGAIT